MDSMVRVNDPRRPNLIWARGPNYSHEVLLQVPPEVIRNLADGHQNSKVGEYWGLIHGAIPNGTGLGNAHALFRGVRRPRSFESRQAEEIHAYVMSPKCSLEFPSPHGGGPVPTTVPRQAVFVAYVEFGAAPVTDVCGEILYWEWVFADSDGTLPKDHQVRYDARLW